MQSPTKNHVVLVVESDILIRMPIAAYLRQCGFKVFEAIDSDEALNVLQQPRLKVEIVLADVESSGSVDGFGLAHWVRRNRPSIDIVLAATVDRAAAKAGDICEKGPHLAKPYNPKILEKRIRELLEAREQAR